MVSNVEILMDLIKTESNIEETCSRIVLDLNSGSISLSKLTENLGHLLTNDDIVLRRGGLEVLCTVLQKLESDFLNDKEIEFLTGYFCNCLLDHHSFIPIVLKGLLALVKMREFPDGLASKIFTVLNLNFTCQSQLHADRNVCYQLLNEMILKKTKELQALGPDFVCGFLSFIDSERDPRNLMYLFTHLPFFYKNFPAGHLLEDAFEAISCYFPVDFRTNPKDPRGISREDLSSALLPCLTAINDFCPFVVPLALDKLASDLTVAKIDSLMLLKKCFEVFPPDQMCPFVIEIVSSLLIELKPGLKEEEIQNMCIDVLSDLFKYLTEYQLTEELMKTWSSVYSSVQPLLNDIHSNFFMPTIKFMSKIASASSFSCRSVVTEIVPKLMSLDCFSDSDIAVILESLKLLLLPCVSFNVHCSELISIWSGIPQLFLKECECNKSQIKVLAINGMTSIVQLCNSEERSALYLILCNAIRNESDVIVRHKCIDCLRVIASIFSEEIKSVLDSQLELNESDLELRKRFFQCWCALASVPEFLFYLERALKMYIVDSTDEFVGFVIEALRDLMVSEKRNSAFLNRLHHELNITKYLMDWWHEGCNTICDDGGRVFDHERIAENLQLIIFIIVRVLDEKSQLDVAIRYFQLTVDHGKRFMSSFQYLSGKEDLDTFEVHCSLSIILFESVVNGLLPVVLELCCHQSLTHVIRFLSTLAVYCSRLFCCIVASKSIATVLNKFKEDLNIEQSKVVFSFTTNIISTKSGSLKTNAVRLLIYATKSLLLRGYQDLNIWLDMLVSLLSDKTVSNTVVEGFQMMCYEDEYFLNEFCHCTVKLFHRQRLFSYVVPKLIEMAKQSEDQMIRNNCAATTVYMLQDLPQSVITKFFKQIIPLLVELLNVNCQAEISKVTLQKLLTLMPDNASIFEEYIETFISKLLILSQSAVNMKVRIAALQCLAVYSKLTPSVVLPFKTKVVHELSTCLDDRKRLVRQQAVKTRTCWIILGVS